MAEKPWKGYIDNWQKSPMHNSFLEMSEKAYGPHLGYVIYGKCIDHPDFGNNDTFYTSLVVIHDGDQIETLNSRYTLLNESHL